MNKFIQKFSHPAMFGFLIAGAIILGGSMIGIPSAHAWYCSGNTSSSPCSMITTVVNVVNAGGGTATPSNFQVTLTDESSGTYYGNTYVFNGSASGISVNVDPEQYQVTVASKKNYTPTYSSDCTGILNAGDAKTCTITETYNAPGPCSLSASQFEAAVASGTISWNPVSTGTSTASFTIKNGTACSAPISLASYEVFESSTSPHFLSTQQLFGIASTTLGASSTATLTVNLPVCMAQVDAFYGSAPTNLLDTNPYSYPNVPFVLAYAFTN